MRSLFVLKLLLSKAFVINVMKHEEKDFFLGMFLSTSMKKNYAAGRQRKYFRG